jgi:hypothetical protein
LPMHQLMLPLGLFASLSESVLSLPPPLAEPPPPPPPQAVRASTLSAAEARSRDRRNCETRRTFRIRRAQERLELEAGRVSGRFCSVDISITSRVLVGLPAGPGGRGRSRPGRARRVLGGLLADRADQQVGGASVPPGADHQKVGFRDGMDLHLSG